jgi:hypothetical protein
MCVSAPVEATSTVLADEQRTVTKYCRALLAGFAIRQELSVGQVLAQLEGMPVLHVMAFQLALKGTGFATEGLVPDGDPAGETRRSLKQLFKAVDGPF